MCYSTSSWSASAGDRTSSSVAPICELDSRLHPCFLCFCHMVQLEMAWIWRLRLPTCQNMLIQGHSCALFVLSILFPGIRPWGHCRTPEPLFSLLCSEESYGFTGIHLLWGQKNMPFNCIVHMLCYFKANIILCSCEKHETDGLKKRRKKR